MLRPLPVDKEPIKACEIRANGKTVGTRISGGNVDDIVFLNREDFHFAENGIRFEGRYGAILSRDGAVASCRGLAISRGGEIWCDTGKWKWDDLPDSPQRDCTARIETGQAAMLPNGAFITACSRSGFGIAGGNFTWNIIYSEVKDLSTCMINAAAVYRENTTNNLSLLLVDPAIGRLYTTVATSGW